jgi:anti-sigma factor RsiW
MKVRVLNRDLVCQQAVELMTDYLEGALSWRQRRRLEKHLRGCPHCRAYLEQMRITIAAMGEVETEPLDAETRDDLIELFQRYRGH